MAPEPAPTRSRGREWTARLLTMVVSTAVALVLAELVSRALIPIPLHATDTFLAAPDSPIAQANRMPRRLRANVVTKHTEPDFSVTVVTNSQGLRDAEIPLAKPPGQVRVLSLGDSFAFGYGVELRQAYCKVAEAMLGDGWLVINAGVPSWGTADELDFLLARGHRYDPDAVVICLFANDFHDNRARGTYRATSPDTVERLSPLEEAFTASGDFEDAVLVDPVLRDICEGGPAQAPVESAPKANPWVRHSNLVRLARQAASRAVQARRGEPPSQFEQQAAEERRLTGALLAELTRKAAPSPTVILLLPSREEVADTTGDEFGESLRDVTAPAEALGATVVDLAPALRAAGRTAYFPHNAHLTPYGHRVVGELLAAELRQGWARRGTAP